MSKVLIIAEHDGAALNLSTAKCVACASELPDAEISVGVFAENGEALAAEAATLAGVSQVIRVDNAANANLLAAMLAPQITALADGYSHIFGPSTTFGKDLMPRVAALLGVNQISDVMTVLGSHSFKRPTYDGRSYREKCLIPRRCRRRFGCGGNNVRGCGVAGSHPICRT